MSNLIRILKNIFQWTSHLINKKNKGGWLLLKGGHLSDELKQTKKTFQQIPISNYFQEDYFKVRGYWHSQGDASNHGIHNQVRTISTRPERSREDAQSVWLV